ncbi:MAG: interleukin-like EMT inducer domain-containing protein [Chloroflexota bacterium]
MTPFVYPEVSQQTMTLVLNGQEVSRHDLVNNWQIFEATLPEENLQPGLNRLQLQFSHQAIPRLVLPPQTAIGQTGSFVPTDIEVNSHADFSFVTVGFADTAVDASTHRRGFNVAVVDPISGEVLNKVGFDTAANQFEDQALQDFIAQLPNGQVVIVSSQGADAAQFLSRGFASVGGDESIPTIPYSLIGIKGAAPGTAQIAAGENAYLRLGANPDTRPLAVAVDWVEIRK